MQGIFVFTEVDVAPAFDAVQHDHPSLMVLQRDLLATPRVEALIGRIRTDPDSAVSRLPIRVTSNIYGFVQHVSRRKQAGLSAALAAPGDPLPPEHDDRRWARRFQIRKGVGVQVDGRSARLADLSHTGAQIVVPRHLRPSQLVTIRLTDGSQVLNLAATVVWASLEPSRDPGKSPDSRAGVTFVEANPENVEAFCQTGPDISIRL